MPRFSRLKVTASAPRQVRARSACFMKRCRDFTRQIDAIDHVVRQGQLYLTDLLVGSNMSIVEGLWCLARAHQSESPEESIALFLDGCAKLQSADRPDTLKFSAQHLIALLKKPVSAAERGRTVVLLISTLLRCSLIEGHGEGIRALLEILHSQVGQQPLDSVISLVQACQTAGAQLLKPVEEQTQSSLDNAISQVVPYEELRGLLTLLLGIRHSIGSHPVYGDIDTLPAGVSGSTRQALLHEDWEALAQHTRADLESLGNVADSHDSRWHLIGYLALALRKLSETMPAFGAELADEVLQLLDKTADQMCASAPAADDEPVGWTSSVSELALSAVTLFRYLPDGSREFPVRSLALLEQALKLTSRDANPVEYATYLHDLAHAYQQYAGYLPSRAALACLEYAASLFRESLVTYCDLRQRPTYIVPMRNRPAHIDYLNLGQVYSSLASLCVSLQDSEVGPYASPLYIRLAFCTLATARDLAFEAGHVAEAAYTQSLLANLATQLAIACLEHTRASKGALRREFHDWLCVIEGPVVSTWDFADRYALFALDQAASAIAISVRMQDGKLLHRSLRAMFEVWRVAEMRHGVSGVPILFDDNWTNMHELRRTALLMIERILRSLADPNDDEPRDGLAAEMRQYGRYFAGRMIIESFANGGRDAENLVEAANQFERLRSDGDMILRALSRPYADWFRVSRTSEGIAVNGLLLAPATGGLEIDVLAQRQNLIIGGLQVEHLAVDTRASSWIKTNSVAAIVGTYPQIDWSGVPPAVPTLIGQCRSDYRKVNLLAVQVPTASWDAWVIHMGGDGDGAIELDIPVPAPSLLTRGTPEEIGKTSLTAGQALTLQGEWLVIEIQARREFATDYDENGESRELPVTLDVECSRERTRISTRAKELTLAIRTTPSIVDSDFATLAKMDSPFAAACGAATFSLISPSPDIPSSLMRAYSPLFLFDQSVDKRVLNYLTNSSHRQLLIVGIPSEFDETVELLTAAFDARRDVHLLVEPHEVALVEHAVQSLCQHMQGLCGAPLYSVAASVDEDVQNQLSIQIVEVKRPLSPSACQMLLDIISFRRLPWEDIPTGGGDSPFGFQLLGDPGLMRRRLTDLPNPAAWDDLVESYVKLTQDLDFDTVGQSDSQAIRSYIELFARPIAKRPTLVVPENMATILACIPYAAHLGALLLPDTGDVRSLLAALQPPELYFVDGCDNAEYAQTSKIIPRAYVELALQFAEIARRDHESRVNPLLEGHSSAEVSASLLAKMRPSAYVVVASISPSECWAAALAANYAAALGSPLLLVDDEELVSSENKVNAGSFLMGTRCFRQRDASRDLVPKTELAQPTIATDATAELARLIEKMKPEYVGVVSNGLMIPVELAGNPPLATKYALGRLAAPDLTSLALLISAAALREEVRRDPTVHVVIAEAADALKDKPLPGARSEADHLVATLSKSTDLLVKEVRGENDRTQVLDALRMADIVHFSGHGTYDDETPSESGLIFTEGSLRGSDIPSALKGNPIVLGNACQSGVVHMTDQAGRGWSGLAAAFIEAGSVNYVGSLWPIFDDCSRSFAERFYALLNEGISIGEAIRMAKVASFLAGDPTWAAIVLFGCPRNRLRSRRAKRM
jgi:hypothetical protein